MINKIFKIGLLVVGILFLFLYYQSSLNNKYHRIDDIGSEFAKVFDSKTGQYYSFHYDTKDKGFLWFIFDPIEGKIKVTKASIDNSGLYQASNIVPIEDLPRDILEENYKKK